MFNRVSEFCGNFCEDYYDQVPAGGLRTVGLSAVVSLVSSLIFTSFSLGIFNHQPIDLSRVALAVGIASLASLIHVLTTPIFNYIFDNPNNNNFNGFQEFARIVFDITLTQVLINHTTAFKINLITALYPQGGNFVIFSDNIIKTSSDMTARVFDYIDPAFGHSFRDIYRAFGMDFSVNSPVVYMVV